MSKVNTAPTFNHFGTLPVNLGFGSYIALPINRVVALQKNGKILVIDDAGANASWVWWGSPAGNYFTLASYNKDGSLDTTFNTPGKEVTQFLGTGNTGDYNQFSATVQENGKILVAGSNGLDFTVARYNSDGKLDKSFSGDGKVITDLGGSYDGARSVIAHSDGKILVAGSGGGSDMGRGVKFALARYNDDGSLDASFSDDGKVTNDFGNLFADGAEGYGVAVQTDDKILMVGQTGGDLAVARYNSNGTLDASFNGNGNVITDFGGFDVGNNIVVQADGKILVSGYSNQYSGTGNKEALVLARYNSDGSLDTGFSGDGKVTTDFGSNVIPRTSFNLQVDTSNIALQADGKILVAGTIGKHLVLARYNSDGSLDSSFDNDGKIAVNWPYKAPLSSIDSKLSVVVDTDGKILVSGSSARTGGSYLVRYNSDGSLDSSFNAYNSISKIVNTQENTPVIISPKADINDTELDALNGIANYGGSSLTLVRHGGGNADDVFLLANQYRVSLTNHLIKDSYDGFSLGTYQQNNGKLVLNFNTRVSSWQIDNLLQHITYSNTSDRPPATVKIDWIFSDGDKVNPLTTTNSTTIHITPMDDAPEGHVSIAGSLTAGNILTASNNLTDADGLGKIGYQWQTSTDGTTWHNLATGSHLGLTQAMLNQQIRVVASYTDAGGTHNDAYHIIGTAGNDRINASLSNDVINGGKGRDWVYYSKANAGVAINLELTSAQNTKGAGVDTLTNIENVSGSRFNDILIGNQLANALYGRNGDDFLIGGKSNDILDGGNGIDWAQYSTATQGVVVNLSLTKPQDTKGAGIDTLNNIENLSGSAFGDTLTGDWWANVLSGGKGNDVLNGDWGNDILQGGLGNDVIDGGDGIDLAQYSDATAEVTVNLAKTSAQSTGGAGIDTLINIENLKASNFNDTLIGNAFANVLYGGKGNDFLYGGDGADILYGNQGDDVIDGGFGIDWVSYKDAFGVSVVLGLTSPQYIGNAGQDTLTNIENVQGSRYNDTLIGNELSNQLLGGSGDDSLNGGLGNDVLAGGLGNDVFIFNTVIGANNIDRITDFSGKDDMIELSKYIFSAFKFTGDLDASAFKIVGNGGMVDSDDHLLYNTSNGYLYYDADGSDAIQQVAITYLGKGLALTDSNFLILP